MPEMKLCFVPHAGGSALGYTNFKKYLDPSIKPVPIELAGRGKRLSEECFVDIHKCTEDLFEKNKEIFEEGNYAFFGHSLGTIVSYELAKLIRKNNYPEPVHMFFSGRCAPHSKVSSMVSGTSKLNDKDFLKAFSVYGAIPDIVMNNPEIMNMILPIMRSDVTMADAYVENTRQPQLKCDITVLYGRNDMIYAGQDISIWEECTSGKCTAYGFKGDHFYYNTPENKEKLCDIINKTLLNR